jgi:hypothetical protein
MREEETTRPLPPGQTQAISNVNAIGNLWDPDLQEQLNAFIARRGADMSRTVDTGLSNKYKMSPSTVLQANAGHWGNQDTPGVSAQMPLLIRSAADKRNAPPGSWCVDGSGVPYRMPARASSAQ